MTNTTAAVNATSAGVFSLHDLDFLDRISYTLPHQFYETLSFVPPDLLVAILVTLTSVLLIVVGAYSTLSKPRIAQNPSLDKKSPYFDPTDNDGVKTFITSVAQLSLINGNEITLPIALSIPVLAGSVLSGLYYLLKNMNAQQLTYYLNWYTLWVGNVSIYQTLNYVTTASVRKLVKLFDYHLNSTAVFERYRLALIVDKNSYPLGPLEQITDAKLEKALKKKLDDDSWISHFKTHIKEQGLKILRPSTIKFSKTQDNSINYIFDFKSLVLIPASLGISYLFYQYNPYLNTAYTRNDTNWILSNLVSLNFAVFGIKQLLIPRFHISFILLLGLFFYDVYFVFGTTIMMDVATGLSIPIKLLIPRKSLTAGPDIAMNLLGLGDIVLPGSLVSLCLRFDLFNHYKTHTEQSFHHLRPFSKPYFWVSMVSYVLGLSTTLVFLNIFHVGQPALLYIVPSMIFGIVGYAWTKGELKQLWAFEGDVVKEFDIKNYVDEAYASEEDSDFELDHSDHEQEFDDWVDKVEYTRLQAEGEDATDLDEMAQSQVVYVFADSDEDDEEDDTFVIEEFEDEEDYDNDEINEFDVFGVLDDDSEDDDILQELELITKDKHKQLSELFSDDEI